MAASACFDSSLTKFLRVIFCERWRTNRKSDKTKPRCLPLEIWEKIFQRLTVKSLGKCICVCKGWKSIITNQAFILAHLSHRGANNKDIDSLFLQYQSIIHPKGISSIYDLPFGAKFSEHIITSEEHLLVRSDDKEVNCHAIISTSMRFACHDLDMVGTCNGLVCFVKNSDSIGFTGVIIMNLSIQKYVILPLPMCFTKPHGHLNWNFTFFGFGFDSKSNDIKVLMFALDLYGRPKQVQVYSLATGKWRSISHGAPSICGEVSMMPKQKLMCLNGALHWMFCSDCINKCDNFISTFDLAEETFGEIMLPNFWNNKSCFGTCLFVRGSCLALVYEKNDALYYKRQEPTYIVCVMKEYGAVDSWDVLCSVDSRQYPHLISVRALMSSRKMVAHACEMGLIILGDSMKKETIKDLKLPDHLIIDFVEDYVESLFLINHNENNAYVNNKGILDVRFVSPKIM